MQAPAHYRRFVRGLKLFEGFTNGEIDVLMGVLRPERLQAEDPVFVQGRLGNACFVVVRGSIRVTLGLGANAQEVATLGQGTLFGQVALIDGGRRSANCIAAEPAVIMRLDRNEFDLLFNSGSSIAFKFLDVLTRILVGQLRNANERLADVATKEQQADKPRSADDDEVQSFLKDLATRTQAFRSDDLDLGDVQVVVSEADKARRPPPS